MTKSPQKKKFRHATTFYVNGVRQDVDGEDNFMMLANWLRRQRELTGTKIVCAEGDCGACTVQQVYPSKDGKNHFQAINSCIKLVGQMDGASIVTIEGVQSDEELSPVQEAMKSCHGSQCGYCTPGFVMAMSGVLESKKKLDSKSAMNCLTGNLCRCTGYQPIIDAATTATYSEKHSLQKRYLSKAISDDLVKTTKNGVQTSSHGKIFFAPTTLKEALSFLNKHKKVDVRIISSTTDLGVQYNKGKPIPEIILSLHLIPELAKITTKNNKIVVGARATLTELRHATQATNPEFANLLNLFASPQIKNTATLVGNVANASPIGDTMPFLMIAGGTVHTASLKNNIVSKRQIPLCEFYQGYKKLALLRGELITHISFEIDHKDVVMKLYKTSARKDLDISTVCAAFSMKVYPGKDKGSHPTIALAKMALGGVAATTIRCWDIEKQMLNQTLTPTVIENFSNQLADSIAPLSDLRGTADYRRVLVKNMFQRFGHEVLSGLNDRK